MALRFNMYPSYGRELEEHQERQSEQYRELGRGLGAAGREYGAKYSPKAREYQKYVSGIEPDRRDTITVDGKEVPNPKKGQPLYAAMTRDVWEGSEEGRFAISEMKKGRKAKFAESPLGKIFMEKTGGGTTFEESFTEEGREQIYEDIKTSQAKEFSKVWDPLQSGPLGWLSGGINWLMPGDDIFKTGAGHQTTAMLEALKLASPEKFDKMIERFYEKDKPKYQQYLTEKGKAPEYKFNPFEGLQKAKGRREERKAGRELIETQEAEEQAEIDTAKDDFIEQRMKNFPGTSREQAEEEFWEMHPQHKRPGGLLGRLKRGYKEKIGDPWREGISEQKQEIAAEKEKEQEMLMRLFRPKKWEAKQAQASSGVHGYTKWNTRANHTPEVKSALDDALKKYPDMLETLTKADYEKFDVISRLPTGGLVRGNAATDYINKILEREGLL